MATLITLDDMYSVTDLDIFLQRSAKLGASSVLCQARGTVLAVFVPVLYPRGILEIGPTVIGLRTFKLATAAEFEHLSPIAELTKQINDALCPPAKSMEQPAAYFERAASFTKSIQLGIPVATNRAQKMWTGILPPQSGWVRSGEYPSIELIQTAQSGIEQVSTVISGAVGEHIVQRVRNKVWGEPIPGLNTVPSGAAFAALALGFINPEIAEKINIFGTQRWVRFSTKYGHVLARTLKQKIAGSPQPSIG